MFTKIFIDRPILSSVISIVIVFAGGIAILKMPTSRYPDMAPPQVKVTATFPGANAETVEKTVAVPIEQEVNGAKGMIYMSSTCGNDGTYTLTCSFEIGSNNDLNSVEVQNRVAIATAKLPREVQLVGVSTKKISPDTLMYLALTSPDGTFDVVGAQTELRQQGPHVRRRPGRHLLLEPVDQACRPGELRAGLVDLADGDAGAQGSAALVGRQPPQ